MARAELTLQTSTRPGTAITFTNALVDGHAFQNERANVLLLVKNDSGASVTVTIATPATIDGLTIPDQGSAVAAGAMKVFGPFIKSIYNQDDSAGDTGLTDAVFVDTSAQTSVSYAAILVGSLG